MSQIPSIHFLNAFLTDLRSLCRKRRRRRKMHILIAPGAHQVGHMHQ